MFYYIYWTKPSIFYVWFCFLTNLEWKITASLRWSWSYLSKKYKYRKYFPWSFLTWCVVILWCMTAPIWKHNFKSKWKLLGLNSIHAKQTLLSIVPCMSSFTNVDYSSMKISCWIVTFHSHKIYLTVILLTSSFLSPFNNINKNNVNSFRTYIITENWSSIISISACILIMIISK